jgi:nitroreductase
MNSLPPVFDPLSTYQEYPPDEMIARSRAFAATMQRRRTVRQFSDRPGPSAVLDACLEAAATAPSGADLQPWHFVVVSDPGLKHQIRVAAEEEEAACSGPSVAADRYDASRVGHLGLGLSRACSDRPGAGAQFRPGRPRRR